MLSDETYRFPVRSPPRPLRVFGRLPDGGRRFLSFGFLGTIASVVSAGAPGPSGMFAMTATAARVLASNLYRCFGITRPSGAWFRERDLLIEWLPPDADRQILPSTGCPLSSAQSSARLTRFPRDHDQPPAAVSVRAADLD